MVVLRDFYGKFMEFFWNPIKFHEKSRNMAILGGGLGEGGGADVRGG